MFQGLVLHGLRHGGKALPKVYRTESGEKAMLSYFYCAHLLHSYLLNVRYFSSHFNKKMLHIDYCFWYAVLPQNLFLLHLENIKYFNCLFTLCFRLVLKLKLCISVKILQYRYETAASEWQK